LSCQVGVPTLPVRCTWSAPLRPHAESVILGSLDNDQVALHVPFQRAYLAARLPVRTPAAPVNIWLIRADRPMIARMSRFADMFIDPATDPRPNPPGQADERAMLAAFLRWQRDTLELKCSGLDAADLARRAVEPATLSLLGLVRHMADVERTWFRRALAGQDAPPLFYSDADPDGDFDRAGPDPALAAEAWAVWRAEVAFAERFVAEAPDLDIVGNSPWRGAVSLRWVLVHMVEEYARHNGHADLLRQRIDGAVGL
jgi:uncharacterized damage-inducible protein DinB